MFVYFQGEPRTMTNNNSTPPSVDSRFETDIVNIDFQLAIADDRMAYDNVFNELCDLLKRAPTDPRVKNMFHILVQKSSGYLDQVRLAYDSEGQTFDVAVESLVRLKELERLEKYDDVIRLGEQLKAQGVKDPEIDMRMKRALEHKREKKEKGTIPEIEQVPFEVRTLIAEANSTLRTQDFKQCIDICKKAEKMLDDSFSTIPRELIDIRKDAEYLNDRKILFDDTAKLIEAGKWDSALQNAQNGAKSFPDELFADLKRRIDDAIKEEATLDKKIRVLKPEPEFVKDLVDAGNALDNLRSLLTSSGQPTLRQAELQIIIATRKTEMMYQFKERGRQNLILATTAPAAKRTMLYEKAAQMLELAIKLSPTDRELNEMLMGANQGNQDVDRQSMRNSLLLKGGLTLAAVVILAVLGLIGYGIFDQMRTSSLTQTAVALVSLQTETERGAVAQETGLANTATQVQLTVNAEIAAQAATPKAAIFNLNSTLTVAALSMAQTGTIDAQTSIAKQNTDGQTSTAIARDDNKSTQLANFNQTQTALAPTPTSTPIPYRCKGSNLIDQAALYQGPSYNAGLLAQIPRGADLEIYEFVPSRNDTAQGWYKVIYRDPESGSVISGYTQGKYTFAPRGCFN
jgi:tetratricopeptide (TPR) repeat protein